MPREAKLFSSSSGSAVRGFLKFRANIPPRWIKNARTSRKRVEPEIVRNLRTLKQLMKNRPHARVAIKDARKESKQCYNAGRWRTTRRVFIVEYEPFWSCNGGEVRKYRSEPGPGFNSEV